MKKTMMFLMAMGAFDSVMATYSAPNLIANGNFAENDCKNDWCIFNGPNCVKGWNPEPQIEIGYGCIYNDNLGKERVLELAPNTNSCVKQTVKSLQPGIYQLKYEYGARKGRSFEDCQFGVSFNGKNLKTITPCDYKIQSDTVEIEVRSSCEGEVRFCGVGGSNNSYGAILKSVSLTKKSDLPVVSPPVYQSPVVNPPVVNPPIYQPPTYQPPVINPPILNPPVLNPPVQNQNPPGIYLDSHSGKCYQRQYQLEAGQIELLFDYKVISNTLVKDSAIYITLDGKPIYKVLPCDSGKTIKLQGDVGKGAHTFGFCAVGCPTQAYHQAFISNVVISQKVCVAGWGNDLIVNGGFQQNQCQSDWCIWNQQTGLNAVQGWIPSPEMEVGKGKIYNSALGSSWVSELDPNTNSCIKQKLVLKPGKHSLNFDWAARTGTKLASNVFEVRVNGQVVKCIQPTDCNVHKQNVQFQLSSCPAESWIEFCGTGKSDSYGALVDNVKLFSYSECATTKIVNY